MQKCARPDDRLAADNRQLEAWARVTERGGSKSGQLVRWLPALAWMGVIFRLSAIPGSQIPGRFGTLGHFVIYAILGALLTVPLGRYRPRGETVAIAAGLAALYAISDEFHQSFVPLRTPDVADWGVDTLGAFCGALAGAYARVWLESAVSRRTAAAKKPQ